MLESVRYNAYAVRLVPQKRTGWPSSKLSAPSRASRKPCFPAGRSGSFMKLRSTGERLQRVKLGYQLDGSGADTRSSSAGSTTPPGGRLTVIVTGAVGNGCS